VCSAPVARNCWSASTSGYCLPVVSLANTLPLPASELSAQISSPAEVMRSPATFAVAYTLLCIAWAVMKHGSDYAEAGSGCYDQRDQRNHEHLVRHHHRALAWLGFQTTFIPPADGSPPSASPQHQPPDELPSSRRASRAGFAGAAACPGGLPSLVTGATLGRARSRSWLPAGHRCPCVCFPSWRGRTTRSRCCASYLLVVHDVVNG
jgi:hypothetical protein